MDLESACEDSFPVQGGPWCENTDFTAFYGSEKERPCLHVTRGILMKGQCPKGLNSQKEGKKLEKELLACKGSETILLDP